MAGLIAVVIASAVGMVGQAVIPLFQGFLDGMGW